MPSAFNESFRNFFIQIINKIRNRKISFISPPHRYRIFQNSKSNNLLYFLLLLYAVMNRAYASSRLRIKPSWEYFFYFYNLKMYLLDFLMLCSLLRNLQSFFFQLSYIRREQFNQFLLLLHRLSKNHLYKFPRFHKS